MGYGATVLIVINVVRYFKSVIVLQIALKVSRDVYYDKYSKRAVPEALRLCLCGRAIKSSINVRNNCSVGERRSSVLSCVWRWA